MRSITISDPGWEETFPHPVSPLQDEWLPGFLLRYDEENGWLSGTTARFVCYPSGVPTLKMPASYVAARHLHLDELAQLLALSVDELLKTTFSLALQRLYDISQVYAYQLGWH